jgi:hypothetical protein
LRGGVAARRGWGRRRGREGGGAEAGEGRKGLSSPGCDGARGDVEDGTVRGTAAIAPWPLATRRTVRDRQAEELGGRRCRNPIVGASQRSGPLSIERTVWINATRGGVVRPSTLVILHNLLQNTIFLPHHQDSLLYIFFSRIHHPLYTSFITTTTRGPTPHPLPFLLPSTPPPPLSLSHPAGSSVGFASPTPPADGGRGVGCPAGQAATTKCRPRAAAACSPTSCAPISSALLAELALYPFLRRPACPSMPPPARGSPASSSTRAHLPLPLPLRSRAPRTDRAGRRAPRGTIGGRRACRGGAWRPEKVRVEARVPLPCSGGGARGGPVVLQRRSSRCRPEAWGCSAAVELHGQRVPPSARVGMPVCAGGGRGGRAASVAQAGGSSSCRRAAPFHARGGAPWPARRAREAEPAVFPSSPSLRFLCFASTAPRGWRRRRSRAANGGTGLPPREGARRGTRGPALMSSLLDSASFDVDPRRRENEGGAPVH